MNAGTPSVGLAPAASDPGVPGVFGRPIAEFPAYLLQIVRRCQALEALRPLIAQLPRNGPHSGKRPALFAREVRDLAERRKPPQIGKGVRIRVGPPFRPRAAASL